MQFFALLKNRRAVARRILAEKVERQQYIALRRNLMRKLGMLREVDEVCIQVVSNLVLFMDIVTSSHVRLVYDFEQISEDKFIFYLRSV